MLAEESLLHSALARGGDSFSSAAVAKKKAELATDKTAVFHVQQLQKPHQQQKHGVAPAAEKGAATAALAADESESAATAQQIEEAPPTAAAAAERRKTPEAARAGESAFKGNIRRLFRLDTDLFTAEHISATKDAKAELIAEQQAEEKAEQRREAERLEALRQKAERERREKEEVGFCC
ncbi:hypothetical protein cyc_07182 [Cyclospora cayetanensis]|uniref:Uncharacterized protein n=1 Tax=Cyclospora cayetanensis TaxID=88456 RepID=A0A1D3CWX8_9EIME|nr:hypothetical protein cyc_07182 [Cyclospora cayetanensis]